MLIDGSLLDGIENLLGMKRALGRLFTSGMERTMMCVWYWSESGWMEYVRQFQSLPDVMEDHCYVYDAALDAARLVPVSMLAGRGRPIRVQIPQKVRAK